MQALAGYALGAVLLTSAALKLARARESKAALSTFGLDGPRERSVAWVALVGAEIVVAAAVARGSTIAAYTGAALLASFAGALVVALARGRAGMPCGCFGARSRVGRTAVVRNLALATGFASLPSLPHALPPRDAVLAGGLGVALIGLALLTVVTVALAREVGELRLRLPATGALEIAEEGPAVGTRSSLIDRFAPGVAARFALAVFSSEGCRLCRVLQPTIETFARDPLVAVEVFDEVDDADVWSAARVPGSPFAVALDLDGTVRAKGTFNSLGDLESILAAAERRTSVLAGA